MDLETDNSKPVELDGPEPSKKRKTPKAMVSSIGFQVSLNFGETFNFRSLILFRKSQIIVKIMAIIQQNLPRKYLAVMVEESTFLLGDLEHMQYL